MALINLGTDHGATYELYSLENVGTLNEDLENYFRFGASDHNIDWRIKTELYNGKWEDIVSSIATKWFFEERYSPKTDNWIKETISNAFITHLRNETQARLAYRLHIEPPEFYEIVWEDIILETKNTRWLLHFGWSD